MFHSLQLVHEVRTINITELEIKKKKPGADPALKPIGFVIHSWFMISVESFRYNATLVCKFKVQLVKKKYNKIDEMI